MRAFAQRTHHRALAVAFCVLLLGLTANLSARGAWIVLAQQAPEETEKQGREEFFKVINFVILVVALGWLLRKPLSRFMAQRSAAVQRALEEGRRALEESQARTRAVEEKLRHLEEEIAALRSSAVQEMEAERARQKEITAREVERVLGSVRAQIDAASRAARLELKAYTAEQALLAAEQIIRRRLDDRVRQRLVARFTEALANKLPPNA